MDRNSGKHSDHYVQCWAFSQKKSSQKSQAHKRRSFNFGVGNLLSEKESRQRATFDQNETEIDDMFMKRNKYIFLAKMYMLLLQWYTHWHWPCARDLQKQ